MAVIEVGVQRVVDGAPCSAVEGIAVEEPLEIRLRYEDAGRPTVRTVAVTMRTPGDDFDLVAGFLFTEGVVRTPESIASIRHSGPTAGEGTYRNAVTVELTPGATVDHARLERHLYTTSSCGVCGKTSIEAVRTARVFEPPAAGEPRLIPDVVCALPEALRAAQPAFQRSGGMHAAALFDERGVLLDLREDVGRHNALDKVLGAAWRGGDLPRHRAVAMVSGRASFELVQKCMMAGLPVLVAVGAPSSLAVDLARECGMTLLGFVRDARFNVYAGPERVAV